jgi:DNA-binding CsgD family transcriptional regulator
VVALIERDQEMRSLTGLLTEVRTGSGRSVLISGPPAIGKTELAMAFSRKAAAAGFQVRHLFVSEEDGRIPFGVLRQLASSVSPAAAAGASSAPGAGGGGTLARNALIRAISTQLSASARAEPLLIVMDDVHLVDDDSAQGLVQLIRRLRTEPVLLLMNETEFPRAAVSPIHTEMLRGPHAHRLDLAPLSRAGVTELLTDALGPTAAERLAPHWHDFSGGNPLLLRALLLEGPEERWHDRPPVGATFTEAALACLHRGGPLALEVARGIAVLGEDATLELLTRLSATAGGDPAHALRMLTIGGLLNGLRFRHPAVRAAVLGDPDLTGLAERHHRAAELLEAEGMPSAKVAAQLVAADRVDAGWAMTALLETARQALRRDDTEEARGCLELAYRQCSSGEERGEVIELLVRAVWQNNPARAMRHVAELQDIWQQQGLSEQRAMTLVKALLWYGHVDEAISVLRRVGDAPLVGESAVELAGIRHWLRSMFPDAYPAIADFFESRLARAEDAAIINGAFPGGIAVGTALAGGRETELVRQAEAVLRNYRMGDWWLTPLSVSILDLIYAGQLRRAEEWCGRMLQEAETRGIRSWRVTIFALRGEMARREGRILPAEEFSLAALDQVSSRSWGVMLGIPLANLISVATARGDYGRAEAYLEREVPATLPDTRYGLHYLEARGRYELAKGQYDLALRSFQDCGRRMREWDLDVPAILPWRTGAAEALLRLGHGAGAARLLDEQQERPTGYHPAVRCGALRVRAIAAEPRERLLLLREAVSPRRGWQSEFELIRALAELSDAYRVVGEQHHARTAARRAWRLAGRCRAEPLARTLLPAYDPRYTGAEGGESRAESESETALSAAEQRVAELASLGHTNREIAAKLYVTVSTVEQHLTRVYRKLHVTRRSALRDRLDPGRGET